MCVCMYIYIYKHIIFVYISKYRVTLLNHIEIVNSINYRINQLQLPYNII